jgi:hypothetical protein
MRNDIAGSPQFSNAETKAPKLPWHEPEIEEVDVVEVTSAAPYTGNGADLGLYS